jgi:transposase InsO family protein
MVVFDYIEVWYNRKRRHSTLGYLSPDAFEQHYQQQQQRLMAAYLPVFQTDRGSAK